MSEDTKDKLEIVAVGQFGEALTVDRLAESLPDFEHLMLPRKWDDSGTGTLSEATCTNPEHFSLEIQELADAIWDIPQDDHAAAVRALIGLLKQEGYFLTAAGSGGYFKLFKLAWSSQPIDT